MTAIRPLCQITAVNEPSGGLLAAYQQLEREHQELEQEFGQMLSAYDVVVRAMRNPKIPDLHFRLYSAMVETYRQLLEGKRQEIEVWRIRNNAGERSERSATRFFQDMVSIGKISYEAGYDKKSGQRKCVVTPLPGFDLPEEFDLASLERKKKERQAEEKRRNQFKDPRQMLQCPECGSNHILWDATPRCEDCHTVYPTVKNIPASEIVIEAELIETTDDFSDWLNEAPTEQRQAVKPEVKIVQTPLPDSAPVSGKIGKHPRGIPCPDCGALESWTPMPAEWGGEVYYCTICYPSMAAD